MNILYEIRKLNRPQMRVVLNLMGEPFGLKQKLSLERAKLQNCYNYLRKTFRAKNEFRITCGHNLCRILQRTLFPNHL